MSALVLCILCLALSAPQVARCEGIAIRSVERIVYGASAADLFRRPESLVIDRERGMMVVADTGHDRLVFFDASGRGRGSIAWGTDDPNLPASEPNDIALDGHSRLFVLDVLRNHIEVLNAAGSRLGFVDLSTAGIDADTRPQFLDVGASGRIYVLYAGSKPGILVLNPNGSLVQRIGFKPTGEGLLTTPMSLDVDADEKRIVVTDPLSAHQVLIFDAQGNPIVSFGEHGTGDGTLSVATFATWGPDSNVWVVDTLRHGIMVFDSEGRQVGRIGGFGRLPGQFYYPVACGFLADHQIVVLERGSARFQVLALDLSHNEPITVQASSSPPGELGKVTIEEVTKQ